MTENLFQVFLIKHRAVSSYLLLILKDDFHIILYLD